MMTSAHGIRPATAGKHIVIPPAALRQMRGRSLVAGKQNHPLPCIFFAA
jgi:hypothetical protein